MKSFHLKLRREVLKSPPARNCCRDAFFAPLLVRRGGELYLMLRKPLRRKLEERLAPLLPDGAELTLEADRPLRIDGLDVKALRKRVWKNLMQHHCAIAFFRGAFVRVGYLQKPKKGYHLEFTFRDLRMARFFARAIRILKLPFKSIWHGERRVLYLKERTEIARCLHFLELYDRALALEDLIASRNIISLVNRQVNFETANIHKQVATSNKQCEQIRKLLDYPDQGFWSPALRELAEQRVFFPFDSYESLGERCSPQLSKSAVNHRFRRIADLYKRIFPASSERNDSDTDL
ncbi:MAG: DNA-binding protein WhiA [Candidatus Riflebacteria bacterium]|nr:DNA-binding protein WhiA [Candidatus Riflebacteria bacterium]